MNTEICGVFSPNTGKYGPRETPYLDTFHVVQVHDFIKALFSSLQKTVGGVKNKIMSLFNTNTARDYS